MSCITGITGVTNHLRLRSQVQPQDVKQRIEKALIRSAEKDAKKIKVEMHDGEVVLSGSVRSRAALEDAKWAAWAVPGVMNVETQLSVDSSVLT
ncbi:MAG: BON domain-containing protein [Proteobacteria bacterium]|nr:BON domain-containing protein [Pseudomonadota bacterium]